jgi:selenide,water dikinase
MRRLLLIGGGHAHVFVLDALARSPYPDCEVTLITPYPRQIYSGMLPGWIAGYYCIEQCAIPISLLASRAGIRFVQSACTEFDCELKQARCANGETIPFDIASIDCGPSVDLDFAPGALEFALPIRPIEGFVATWPGLLERARQATSGFTLAIVGDGAAGTELAFAVQQRFALEQFANAQVTLIGSNALPLSGLPERLRNTAVALLKQRRISCLANRRAIEFLPGRVRFSDATSMACDACLLVTGAAAPAWPAASGLACDENGFIRVTPTLQSTSHPFVFAAGDVAAYADPRPKSGVFAVRAGPLLANNLRSALTGKAMPGWAPQGKALYLISTGKRHALAAWGPLSTQGEWVWRWKDRIDRRFMQRFS